MANRLIKPNKDAEIEPDLLVSKDELKANQSLDPTSVEEKIRRSLIRIADLKDTVAKMKKETRDRDDKNYEDYNTLKRENLANMDKIYDLEEKLKRSNQDHRDDLDQTRHKQLTEIRDMNDQNYEKQNKKDAEITRLSEKLKEYNHFLERETRLEKKISEMNQEFKSWKYQVEDERKTHVDKLQKLEKDAEVRHSKMKYDQSMRLRDEKSKFREEAQKEVFDTLIKTDEEHSVLKRDFEIQEQELQHLTQEKEKLTDENKGFKRNVTLQEEGTLEYQAINYRQASKIRKLKEKIDYLKNYISQEVAKYTKEIETLKYQHQLQTEQIDSQNLQLGEQLQSKYREIKNLKAVAQMILDQRTEIEEFFLESVDIVRDDIKRKSTNDLLKQPTRFTEPLTKSKSDFRGKLFSDKIDFSSLAWDDKEKILRILFSKMNAGVPPSNWRTQFNVMNPTYQKAEKTLEYEESPDYHPRPYFNPEN